MITYLGFLCPISRSKFLLFTTSDFHSVSEENDMKIDETERIATQILVTADTSQSISSKLHNYTHSNTFYIKRQNAIVCNDT